MVRHEPEVGDARRCNVWTPSPIPLILHVYWTVTCVTTVEDEAGIDLAEGIWGNATGYLMSVTLLFFLSVRRCSNEDVIAI